MTTKTKLAQAITVISPSATYESELTIARDAVANVALKTGEVIKHYADIMNAHFDLRDNEGAVTSHWYDLKGKLRAGVKVERELFKQAMLSRGCKPAYIDVQWQRVNEASGRVKTVSKVTGGNSVDDATTRDLKMILNRIDNADNAPLSMKIVALLVEAADLIGIDVSAYAIGQEA